MTYPKQMYWDYTKFTSEFMKISMTIFSLGRYILKSLDKHPYHDDEDMSISKTGSLILSKSPSSKYEGNEKMECLDQLKHSGSRNTKGSAQDVMQLQRHQIQRL